MAPNPIDFDKVWDEFRRLGQTGNYVVLATVCSMLGLYVVGLIFARRADKKDLSKVKFLLGSYLPFEKSRSKVLTKSDFSVKKKTGNRMI